MHKFKLFSRALFSARLQYGGHTTLSLLHNTVCYLLMFPVPHGFVSHISLHPQQVNYLQPNVMPIPIVSLARMVCAAVSNIDFAHSPERGRCRKCAWIPRKIAPSDQLNARCPDMSGCIVFRVRGPIAQCGDICQERGGAATAPATQHPIPDCVEWLYLSSLSIMKNGYRSVAILFLSGCGNNVSTKQHTLMLATSDTEDYTNTTSSARNVPVPCLPCCDKKRGSVLERPVSVDDKQVTSLQLPTDCSTMVFGPGNPQRQFRFYLAPYTGPPCWRVCDWCTARRS